MISPSSRQLAVIYLTVALVASSCVCHEAFKREDLELLCENNPKLSLSRASQIRALAEGAKLNSISCPAYIIKALLDLNDLIQANQNYVCSLEAVNKIRIYHKTHVASAGASGQQQQDDPVGLPLALRNLFLAYGLQVSRICKINMIPTLMYSKNYLRQVDEPKHLEEHLKGKLKEYYELLGGLLQAGGKIDNLIKTPIDYDDLLLTRDIEQLVQGQADSSDSEKLFVQAKSLHALRVFKAICERRYKPVYRQLILPVLYLSNLGLNYRGEDLERELNEMQANEKVHMYYRVAFFCEAIENIEPVEDLEDAEKNEGADDTQIVRVLSADEAEVIRNRNRWLLVIGREGKYGETNKLIDSIERFVFEPNYTIQLGDEILDESNSDLMKLVRTFRANQTELDRIRSRFMRKFRRAIADTLRGHLKVVFGNLLKLDSSAGGTSTEAAVHNFGNSELMELLDEYLDETHNNERPVAGWFDGVRMTGRQLFFRAARATREDYRPKIEDGIKRYFLSQRFCQMLGFLVFFAGVASLIPLFG